MQVFTLLGFIDFDSVDVLGVYGSAQDMQTAIDRQRSAYTRPQRAATLGFQQLGYVVSDLGSDINMIDDVIYLS